MALGEALRRRTHLCLVGCTPGIFFGQPERTTDAIDVWEPQSTFDRTELARACERVGWLCDPTGEFGPGAVCLRILRPGATALPQSFELQKIETYRRLSLSMPRPPMLVAAALAGASANDIDDFVFWMGERRLKIGDIEQAVEQLEPGPLRDSARDNLILARLVATDGLVR